MAPSANTFGRVDREVHEQLGAEGLNQLDVGGEQGQGAGVTVVNRQVLRAQADDDRAPGKRREVRMGGPCGLGQFHRLRAEPERPGAVTSVPS